MSYHIEGMGVLGMQVAWELERLGEDFTWSDTEEEHTAWHCSTGIVYPSGEDRDLRGLHWWNTHADELGPYVERTPYVFAHKNPPHGGRYLFSELGGQDIRMAMDSNAVAVNVPSLVRLTRSRLADQRTDGPSPAQELIVAHSTPERLDGYLWGWCARVTFDGPLDEVATYYAKKHRFNLTYAYPIPGDGQWWAGSVLRYQAEPRSYRLSVLEAYVNEWMDDAEELLGLKNIEVHSLEQGWRPRRRKGEPNTAVWNEQRRAWVLAPEPTSGVRHGPLIVADLFAKMGVYGEGLL